MRYSCQKYIFRLSCGVILSLFFVWQTKERITLPHNCNGAYIRAAWKLRPGSRPSKSGFYTFLSDQVLYVFSQLFQPLSKSRKIMFFSFWQTETTFFCSLTHHFASSNSRSACIHSHEKDNIDIYYIRYSLDCSISSTDLHMMVSINYLYSRAPLHEREFNKEIGLTYSELLEPNFCD